MTTLTETAVARAFAQAVSSHAVTVTTMQASIWLFGGCALEPEIDAYLNSIAGVHGYILGESDFNREKFVDFMTPLVGDEVAARAADIVEDQF